MVFNNYSSLNDFGTSGSKNTSAQYVEACPPILVNKFDNELNKNSIVKFPLL